MKKLFTTLFLLSIAFAFGQNAFRSADGWGDGWVTNKYFTFQTGNSAGWNLTNSAGSGFHYYRFYSQTGSCTTEWGPSGADLEMIFGTEYNLTQGNSFAYKVNVANTTNHYIFKTKQFDACSNPKAVVFEVAGAIRTVTGVSQTPNGALTDDVVVTANFDGALNAGQAVYLRYTKDNFATSTVVKFTGSGTTYTATIPASFNTTGSNVKYYVFTSTENNVATDGSNADFYAFNLNNNGGSNYSYTVSNTTTWNGSNWSNGAPNAFADAIIYDNATLNVTTAITSKKLLVYSGATLNINDGGSWTAVGNVENYNAINVNDGGNFIQGVGSAYTGTGTFSLNKNTTSAAGKYVFWSSPVVGQNMFNIYGAAGTPQYVMTYDSNNDIYAVQTSATAGAGIGYSVKVPATAASASFTGTPHNGDVPVTLDAVATDNANGNTWNLIGNPYPSNLNLVSLYNGGSNGIESSIYLWDNISATNTSQQQAATTWAIFNASGTGTWSQAGSLTVSGVSVKPGQGFIVKGKAGSATFTNAMRNADAATFANKSAQNSSEGKYWLTLTTPSGSSFSTAVTYGEGAQNTYEAFDSAMMGVGSEGIYSYLAPNKLAIQGRADFVVTDVVALGNKQSGTGNYTISLADKTGLFTGGQPIYLRDKLLGTYTDLQAGSYSFAATALEQQDRFEVVYQTQGALGTSENVKAEVQVYKEGDHFTVTAPEKIKSITVYDSAGRVIKSFLPNVNKYLLSLETKGVYLLKIKLEYKETTKKIIR